MFAGRRLLRRRLIASTMGNMGTQNSRGGAYFSGRSDCISSTYFAVNDISIEGYIEVNSVKFFRMCVG